MREVHGPRNDLIRLSVDRGFKNDEARAKRRLALNQLHCARELSGIL